MLLLAKHILNQRNVTCCLSHDEPYSQRVTGFVRATQKSITVEEIGSNAKTEGYFLREKEQIIFKV